MGSTPTTAPPEEGPVRRRPGDVVAIREIWDGRVWYARPAVVVRDEPNLTMLHVPAGVTCMEPVDDQGRPLRLLPSATGG